MILYDTTVRVKRLKGSGTTKHYVATATGDASIQPIANEPNAVADGRFGTLYVAYVEVDLAVGSSDQVIDPDGVIYLVKEVIKRDVWPFPHQELTLTRQTT